MRLILLHALPFDGRMWAGEMDLLPHRTMAPTMYGFGSLLDDWAAGVLSTAGADPCIVVGCSVGGSCTLEVARAAPEQVVGIVLVGAKADVRPEPMLRDEALSVVANDGMSTAWTRYWEPLFGRSSSDARRAGAALAATMDPDDVARGLRAFHDRRDLTDFAAQWTRPLVVISGDEDRSPPPSTTALLASGPNRRFHLVENCGHYVNLEQPAVFRSLMVDTIAWMAENAGIQLA